MQPKPENTKMLSASPFRATIRFDDTLVNIPDDGVDFERDGTLTDQSPFINFKKSRSSPIKEDSVMLRKKSTDTLNSMLNGSSI
jgi:hypothetical protein